MRLLRAWKTQPRPRAALRAPQSARRVRRIMTPVGLRPVKGKSPGSRDGASKDADAPGFGASDSGASRVARRSDPREVPANAGTCAFRRAIPLDSGEGKEERRRANPRAQANNRGCDDLRP